MRRGLVSNYLRINTMKKLLLIGLAFSFFLSSSFAQNPSSVLIFNEDMSQGKRTGCSLIFYAFGNDYKYKKGAPIIVWGNIFYGDRGVWMLKLETSSSSESLNHIINNEFYLLKSEPIDYAWMKSDTFESSAGKEINYTKSERGGFLGVYKMDTESFMHAAFVDKVDMAFNRKKGGSDVVISIDMKGKDNEKAKLEYGECILKMTKEMQQELQSKK